MSWKIPRWSVATIKISSWYWESLARFAYSWMSLRHRSARSFTTFISCKQFFILIYSPSSSQSSTFFCNQWQSAFILLNINQLFDPTKESILGFTFIRWTGNSGLPGGNVGRQGIKNNFFAISRRSSLGRSSSNSATTTSSCTTNGSTLTHVLLQSFCSDACWLESTSRNHQGRPTNPYRCVVHLWQVDSSENMGHE